MPHFILLKSNRVSRIRFAMQIGDIIVMIEEISNNLFRIGVPLPNNPLKELNSYFIRGIDQDLLIDTGFRNSTCQSILSDELQRLGSQQERRNVLATHFHSDHSGMADLFVGRNKTFYMSEPDLTFLHRVVSGEIDRIRRERYLREGLPLELMDAIYAVNPANQQMMTCTPQNCIALHDGDVLSIGEYNLKTILVPGHTPGNSMFWCEEQGIMFCGDHILFDITPNIAAWVGLEDSLGDYINNLRRVRNYPVKLALPGHRKTGNYSARIDALLLHHNRRLQEVFRIVEETPGLNAYEITQKMTWHIRAKSWDEFPIIQQWFALGECLSHLDHLFCENKLKREYSNGYYRYYANPGKTQQV